MDRTEALEHFYQNCVKQAVIEKISQAEHFFDKHKDELVPDFVDSFRRLCMKIKKMQIDNKIGKIGYIQYSMLRSNIIENNYDYLIDTYNKQWYFDSKQQECQEKYNSRWAFIFLEELEKVLEEKRRIYINTIYKPDIDHIKLEKARIFNQFIKNLARYAMPKAAQILEFNAIDMEDEFEVRVGEYYDLSEVVYKVDMRVKDPEEIKEWLEDKKEDCYVAEILRDMDLSLGNYTGIDLRFADFSGSNLSGSILENSILIGTKFCRCNLENINLTGTYIHDADFSGASLKNADFFTAKGSKSMIDTIASRIYSLWGVNFEGADLEGADFRYTDLRGANFKSTNLIGVNFKGANLENAVFLKEAVNGLELDEAQKKAIQVVSK